MKFMYSEVTKLSDTNPYKLVEKIGKICYKSESNITSDSYMKFIRNLITRKHFAMLEHGRVTCQVTFNTNAISSVIESKINSIYSEFQSLPKCYIYVYHNYSHVEIIISCSLSHLYNNKWIDENKYPIRTSLLSAIRHYCEYTYGLSAENTYEFGVEYEFNTTDAYSIKFIKTIKDIEDADKKFNILEIQDKLNTTSLKFICDRAVSHELVRHRLAIAQESQRYCGYDKLKFGNCITFMLPSQFYNKEKWSRKACRTFLHSCKVSEKLYFMLRKLGMKPEIARTVLTNAVKTEVVLTGTSDEWRHFLDMRYHQTTGSVHPDMLEIAYLASKFLN